ncbi:DET1 [Biomphalaria glabrata]|uniref:DET1 homolog n=1 Tax=Biomphalaria glabrata TaxID=6526 RepID=A0A9W2ZGA8_BIOGL|nr:DET1 homolog [Biomphalaria glabrata]XP_055874079.1 DET1 homolog [Biomphalaria glabrata]XP_055874084.1 DET1 homolog [Biomphalaria glabrata]XP_055874089.1 DET1 homolog [Biomphalaria glabrata]XP_055874095.1 DET1 homolog [Biomphalaria glabrata]KAI8756108.1 putative DET1 [Biomphalaria glabrata]KAI8793651.1 DET1 [Biomphalaria glabrata]
MDDTEGPIKWRKLESQNIVHRLFERETQLGRKGLCFVQARQFYLHIVPNFSILNVEKPPCYLRKFSPDGRFFIAISYDQTSLEIYDFKGSEAAGNLYKNIKGDIIPGSANSEEESTNIRGKIFSQFLQRRHVVRVTAGEEVLNRECSLFTDDSQYVIIGSCHQLPEESSSRFYDVYRNNECITPNYRLIPEDYTLYIIQLKTGMVCDRRRFRLDKIYLSHNQGICLYGNILTVLSVQQQVIHVFHISSQGTFIPVRTIGRFCYDDDEIFYRQTSNQPARALNRPYTDKSLNALKHRLLVYLYKAACNGHIDQGVRSFHWAMDDLMHLRMGKLQLLDEEHLLIKYAIEEVVTFRNGDPCNMPSLFVVYNMNTTEVLGVYEHTSAELLELMENFQDHFRNSWLHLQPQFPSSPSSSEHARRVQNMFKWTLIVAKNGGKREAISRMLTQLPISAQSYSCSPYLDNNLFSYDDKWVSQLERPKTCGDHPIRFFTRNSGMLRFKINTGPPERQIAPNNRRLVAFVCHPTEPFIISVQRTAADYKVNFHIRKCPV